MGSISLISFIDAVMDGDLQKARDILSKQDFDINTDLRGVLTSYFRQMC
jgi:hypothetical protein